MTPDLFADRRARLLARVGGPILLHGCGTRARNLPMNALPFRQDSTFWYFTGCALPDAACWIDADGAVLYLPTPDPDDVLWHGEVPGPAAVATALGFDAVDATVALADRARSGHPRTLAVADAAVNARLTAWTGRPHAFGREPGDPELIDAVIALRRTKDEAEIAQLRAIGALSAEAHAAVMRATRPGVTERSLAVLFEAYLATRGADLGYATILTQQGEVLHHHGHDGVCAAGRLLLLDGGGEWRATGYGADITRTWPVSGRFTPRQRAAYDAVLAAQQAALAVCRPGVRYRAVHDAACRVLARFLLDEGLLRGVSVDEAVERGAHALFFPHGVGHLLGLDVHDLENFGDRPAYPEGQGRPDAFGTANLRLDLPLEPGWVVTVEPGFYVVPAILRDPVLRARFADVLDADRAAGWEGFGGIRIEDDVWITSEGCEVLTRGVVSAPEEVEALVGAGIDQGEVFGW